MSRLRTAAANRLRAWAARRHGKDALPHTVGVRRIYILPTAQGLVFAALVLAMLLAGLNYNSNLGLAFGFLMASMAMVVMHHCHRNLLGLSVDYRRESDGFAGGHAPIEVQLANASGTDRFDIEVRCEAGARLVGIAAGASQLAIVEVPTPVRGLMTLRSCELRTRYPLGWFRAWTYVQAPLAVYVAPQPAGNRAPAAASAAPGSAAVVTRQRGDEDFAGLGPYSPGIPLKHMAWKTLARGGEAAVRNYLDTAGSPQMLEWDMLPGVAAEARLAQLCRWVLDAESAGRAYGLRIPGTDLAPDQGAVHRTACLRALAAYAPGRNP